MVVHFDKQLLDHIKNGRNDEANAMLNEELARAFDDSAYNGTLLHHAAQQNNVAIARRLIELGADVDRHGGRSTTPLTIAVQHANAAIIQVLLEAGARVDIVDDNGSSALQCSLTSTRVETLAFELLFKKLRTEARTNEALVEILMRAGCNMYHAAALSDFELMECMLQRGVDINSKGSSNETALHVATFIHDLNLADWLFDNGIDLDAVDAQGEHILIKSVWIESKAMVQWLLEHGVNPDLNRDEYNCYTPLFAALVHLDDSPECAECAELLLQYGASLRNSEYVMDLFDDALERSCDRAVKLLIARLAMLEMLGEPVDKSVMESVKDYYQEKMSELRKYYEPCQQVLKIKVFEKLSLLDLLNESDRKMKLLARKKTLVQGIEKISSENKLRELYPFYYNSMMRRIEKAKRVVKLEDEATLVICKIYEATYNQFYHFARGVIEYLNERDLVRLVQV